MTAKIYTLYLHDYRFMSSYQLDVWHHSYTAEAKMIKSHGYTPYFYVRQLRAIENEIERRYIAEIKGTPDNYGEVIRINKAGLS